MTIQGKFVFSQSRINSIQTPEIQSSMLLLNFNIQDVCQPMEGHQKVLVVCSHSSTKETRNTAVQESNEVIDGAQLRLIMMLISNGASVPVASCATEAIQMVTAAIFHSYMAVKCTRRVQLKTTPGPGVPLRTIMTWISSGAIAEVM